MGFRFRKSVKLGPVRVNLSKSGIGYSVGSKGLRFTKKAGGGTRTTASIPGTGISYVKDSSSAKTKSTASTGAASPVTKPKKNKAAVWAAVIACLALLGACNDIVSNDPITTEPSIVETTAAPTDPVDAVTEATSQTADEMAAQESQPASEPAIQETTQPQTDPTEPPTEKPTEAPTEPKKETRTYVLNTNTKKFHHEGCSSVKDIKESNKKILETTRDDVLARGYEPCGRCKP